MGVKFSLYLACYDIPSDKEGNLRRRKIDKFLSIHGYRVQESVFELRIKSTDEFEEIKKSLQKLTDAKEDSLRIYPIHGSVEREIEIIGAGEVFTLKDAYIF